MNINELIEELVFIENIRGDKFQIETFSNILFVLDEKGNNVDEINIH